MLRHLLLLILCLLLFVVPLSAQESEVTPEPVPTQAEPRLEDYEELLADIEAIRDDARTAADMAFNLLGLFEALSFVVTIVGGAAAIVGFRSFNQARGELDKTREEVKKEVKNIEDSLKTLTDEQFKKLEDVRDDLENTAEEERKATSNALLANALIPLGERQYKATDYAGALTTYNRARELDGDNPVVHQRLGYVYTASGKLDEAKYHYEQAIEREENFAPALAGLGFVYRRLGEQAEKRMENRTLSEEERTKAMVERKQLLNRAEQLLLRALELSPRLVDEDGESWWGVLGGLYKRRDQIDDAIDAYKQATRVTPQSSYGQGNLALLYMKQNRRDEMLETYEKVEQIARQEATREQGNFWGYADLITSSLAIGKHEQALDAVPIAISIAPVESPYMLEGLTDTLRDLVKVLEDEKVIHIQTAIRMLEDEMQRRAESAAD